MFSSFNYYSGGDKKYPEVIEEENGNGKNTNEVKHFTIGGLTFLEKSNNILCFKENISFGLK
jgi:hypothetical protein